MTRFPLIAFIAAAGVCHAAPPPLVPATRAADTRSAPYIRGAVERVEQTLERVQAALARRGVKAPLVASGAFGSGFLSHTQVGRDLDYFTLFDLGTARPGARSVEAVLRSMEAVLGAFAEDGLATADAGMGFIEMEGLAPDGRLANRAEVAAAVDEALRRGDAEKEFVTVLPGADGRRVPVVLTAHEAALPDLPAATYASNLVRYRENMVPSVRLIQIQVYFMLRVQRPAGARILLFSYRGPPGVLMRPVVGLPVFAVFPSEGARERFAEVVGGAMDKAMIVVRTAYHLIDMVEHDPKIHKSVKRLHQVQRILEGALSPEDRAALDRDLLEWLSAPAATVFSDLTITSRIMQEVLGSPRLEAVFRKSGDVERAVRDLTALCGEAAKRHPAQAKQIEELIGHLRQAGEAPPPETGVWVWRRIGHAAQRLETELAPGREELLPWAAKFKRILGQAGFATLPVVDVSGDNIQVSSSALAEAGVEPREVEDVRFGRFKIETVGHDGRPPSGYVVVRPDPSPQEEAAWSALRAVLP
jgi:hypothetical protein